MSDLVPEGTVYAAPDKKCCNNCALRRNSIERADPYDWLFRVEYWAAGGDHICHKTIPGHPGYDPESGRPDFQLCAGANAMKGKPLSVWTRHIGQDAELIP